MNSYAEHLATNPLAIAFAHKLQVALAEAKESGDQERINRVEEKINQFYATHQHNGQVGIHMSVML